jgi:uncharacterized protein (TIGR03435 family)
MRSSLLASAAGIVLIGSLNTPRPSAQGPAADAGKAAFEVASVKPNKSGNGPRVDMVGGRFTTINLTLRDLVKLAYPVGDRLRNDDQIVGGPNWINADRFDVVAAASGVGAVDTTRAAGAVAPPESAALNQVRAMVRNLLADRFKLAVHHESRDLSNYELVMARSDGRLGPQLRKSDVDCSTLLNNASPPAPLEGAKAACGGFRLLGPGRMTAHAVTLPMLVSLLSNFPAVGRIVVDGTGLRGSFDLDLEWIPDQPSQQEPLHGASIFTALQEQLGLKLESARGPIDVLVIDHAEQPTPD